MADAVDFDALARTAREAGTDATMEQLWRAVYALEQWHFVARGELPDVRPFIGVIDQRPFIMGFTNRDRAQQFAKANNLVDSNGNVFVLSIPVQGFVETAEQYTAHGVFGILFNSGGESFFAPLHNLLPMWQYIRAAKR